MNRYDKKTEESSARHLKLESRKKNHKQRTKISTLWNKRTGTTMRKVSEKRFSEKFSHSYPHFHVATPPNKSDMVCFMLCFVATAKEYTNWVINTTLDFRSLHCGVHLPRSPIAQSRYINQGHYAMSYTHMTHDTHLTLATALHTTVTLTSV